MRARVFLHQPNKTLTGFIRFQPFQVNISDVSRATENIFCLAFTKPRQLNGFNIGGRGVGALDEVINTIG